jgi:hypothetical protein
MANTTFGSLTIGKTTITPTEVLLFVRRRRFLTISIISWAAMAALAVAVVVPQVQKILAIRSEMDTVQTKLDADQSFVTSLQALNSSDVARANVVLSATLPQEKPVLPLLYSLNRLAASAQVSVSEFEITPGLLGTGSGKLDDSRTGSTIDPQLAALPLRMNVAGPFDNLSSFFKSLDFVLPLIQIRSIEFSTTKRDASTATNSAQYSANVELSTLYMKSKPPTGVETTISDLSQSDLALIEKLSSSYAQREADNAAQVTEASSAGRTNLFVIPQ